MISHIQEKSAERPNTLGNTSNNWGVGRKATFKLTLSYANNKLVIVLNIKIEYIHMSYFRVFITLLFSTQLLACAGRTAYPVTVYQVDDDHQSCLFLRNEIKTIETNIQRLIPEADKTRKNIALGLVGVIVWPAWLFMDLSSAEKEEINAYRMRYDRLMAIYQEKNCGTETPLPL